MNRYRMFFVQTSTLPSSMHWKLTKLGRCCMQNHQLPTKSHVKLQNRWNTYHKYGRWKKNMCCELTKPACSGCGWWQVREKMTNPSWVHLSWFPQHGHGLHLSSAHPAILWSLMKWQEPFVTSSSSRKVSPADNLEFVGCCERQIGGTNFTWDGQTIHALDPKP